MAKTQVGIVGAGPAGLLLSHLLHLQGIESVVLENRTRDYVESRVRAGVCEQGTVDVLTETGVGERLHREGIEHHGIEMRFKGRGHRIDFPSHTGGKCSTVYGQQEIVKDLIQARLDAGGEVHFEAEVKDLKNLEGPEPSIVYQKDGEEHVLTCDYIAGCDGFHGVSRQAAPEGSFTIYDRSYPYAWLGILAEAAPSSEELIYANHERGFALHSLRSPTVTRNYIQVDPNEEIENWPDERIWEELQRRLEGEDGFSLNEGPVFDKGITGMRSFLIEPMQYERLFIAGDAAHIVPPTGAKGMNLAIADVRVLAKAFADLFCEGDDTGLANYSAVCLDRVWKVTRFSWWMTTMLHRLPTDDDFGHKLQLARLEYACTSEAAITTLAENYVGLPLEV